MLILREIHINQYNVVGETWPKKKFVGETHLINFLKYWIECLLDANINKL
jgi:hypothetical protein